MHKYDHCADEIETRDELDVHLAANTLAGLTVQGLHLDTDPPDLSKVDVTGTLFIGCHFASVDTAAELVCRSAHVIAEFAELPYPMQPARLYTPEDITARFPERGFAGMYDTVVYQHFLRSGGTMPSVREALAQRTHDHGIDDAIADTIEEWAGADGGPVVGIMGGHAEPRGSEGYRAAAAIGYGLARAGCLVVTGGGPGVMEAANLGAFLCEREPTELAAAIDALTAAPDFHDHDPYTKLALDVREQYDVTPRGAEPTEEAEPAVSDARRRGAGVLDWARHGGLSVPTWLYGHEPANLFAARIAKYFSNAIREDTILRLARGGIAFAAGRAGTIQEIFQAATKTFYATEGSSGPFVFLGHRFWTEELPVAALLRPLLARSPHGDLRHLIRITDDPVEAVEMILEYGAPARAKDEQLTTP